MPVDQAARKGDPISHSYASMGADVGLTVGISVGIVVGVLLAEDPGDAINAGCTIATFGKSLGQLIGSHWTDDEAGKIKDGAATVFIGQGMPNAARMTDPLECFEAGGMTGNIVEQALLTASGPVGGLVVATKQLANSIEALNAGEGPP